MQALVCVGATVNVLRHGQVARGVPVPAVLHVPQCKDIPLSVSVPAVVGGVFVTFASGRTLQPRTCAVLVLSDAGDITSLNLAAAGVCGSGVVALCLDAVVAGQRVCQGVLDAALARLVAVCPQHALHSTSASLFSVRVRTQLSGGPVDPPAPLPVQLFARAAPVELLGRTVAPMANRAERGPADDDGIVAVAGEDAGEDSLDWTGAAEPAAVRTGWCTPSSRVSFVTLLTGCAAGSVGGLSVCPARRGAHSRVRSPCACRRCRQRPCRRGLHPGVRCHSLPLCTPLFLNCFPTARAYAAVPGVMRILQPVDGDPAGRSGGGVLLAVGSTIARAGACVAVVLADAPGSALAAARAVVAVTHRATDALPLHRFRVRTGSPYTCSAPALEVRALWAADGDTHRVTVVVPSTVRVRSVCDVGGGCQHGAVVARCRCHWTRSARRWPCPSTVRAPPCPHTCTLRPPPHPRRADVHILASRTGSSATGADAAHVFVCAVAAVTAATTVRASVTVHSRARGVRALLPLSCMCAHGCCCTGVYVCRHAERGTCGGPAVRRCR